MNLPYINASQPHSIHANAAPSFNMPSSMPFLPPDKSTSAPTIPSHTPNESSEPPKPTTTHSTPTPRKRTRATPEQLAVLEKTFSTNPTPNSRVREQLANELGMPDRSIQIWFQNRRAKVKNMAKRSSMLHNETVRMQYYAAAAASAACQAAAFHQQQMGSNDRAMNTPDLYYYYYYYYYNQQQQYRQYTGNHTPSPYAPPPPPMMGDLGSTPPPPPASSSIPTIPLPRHRRGLSESATTPNCSPHRLRAHSLGPYPLPANHHHNSHHMSRPMSVDPLDPTQNRSRSYTSPAAPPWPALYEQSPSPFNNAAPGKVYKPCGHLIMLMYHHHHHPLAIPSNTSSSIGSNTNSGDVDRFSAEALQIGTWRRMTLQPEDMVCNFDTQRRMMVWTIRNGAQQFKMEFPFDTILQISLEPILERLGWARLEFRLAQPEGVAFYMMQDPTSYWTQCRDFTQDSQATIVNIHQLDGPAMPLQAEIQRLVSNDPHLQTVFVDSSTEMLSLFGNYTKEDDLLLFQGMQQQ